MTRYGLQGEVSKELATYGGRILVHDNPHELSFLITGAKVVQIPKHIPEEQTIPLSAHPNFAHMRWPIRKEDFR